jgi:hypothetical protein
MPHNAGLGAPLDPTDWFPPLLATLSQDHIQAYAERNEQNPDDDSGDVRLHGSDDYNGDSGHKVDSNPNL